MKQSVVLLTALLLALQYTGQNHQITDADT